MFFFSAKLISLYVLQILYEHRLALAWKQEFSIWVYFVSSTARMISSILLEEQDQYAYTVEELNPAKKVEVSAPRSPSFDLSHHFPRLSTKVWSTFKI